MATRIRCIATPPQYPLQRIALVGLHVESRGIEWVIGVRLRHFGEFYVDSVRHHVQFRVLDGGSAARRPS